MRMTNNEYNTILSNRCPHVVVHMTYSNSGNTVCVFYLPLYLYCVIKINNMFSYLSFFFTQKLYLIIQFFFLIQLSKIIVLYFTYSYKNNQRLNSKTETLYAFLIVMHYEVFHGILNFKYHNNTFMYNHFPDI